jgi:ParB family chromosome partitioning protein
VRLRAFRFGVFHILFGARNRGGDAMTTKDHTAAFIEADPELVDVPKDRLRGINAAMVEVIAKTAAATGLLSPIVVTRNGKRYKLVDGAHRLAASKLAKMPMIGMMVRPDSAADGPERQLAEIVANVARAELNALERAENLAALKALHEQLYPENRGGDRRSASAKIKSEKIALLKNKTKDNAEIFSFRTEAAAATGLSTRAIELAIRIAHGLTAASKVRIRPSWIASHQSSLLALALLDAGKQSSVLDILLQVPPATSSVADALILAEGKRLKSAADKKLSAMIGGFGRLPKREKEAFLDAHKDVFLAHATARGWLT